MQDNLSERLAETVRSLRESRGVTQAQAARLAQVPRATWAHLESGEANPTLAVLDKVASALQVTLEELVSPPKTEVTLTRCSEIREVARGLARIRKLLPDPIPGVELDRFDLPPGARMAGVPHTAGTREYLTCERGQVSLAVGGEQHVLEAGDVVSFRGDQRHGYANRGSRRAVAYSVVLFARR